MIKLIIIITTLVSINCCSDCLESCLEKCRRNGVFGFANDRHSYVECINGRAYLRHCSQVDNTIAEYNRQIFDGQGCVDPYICPTLNGRFRITHNSSQYYECRNGIPSLYTCPHGYVFDGQECSQPFRCSEPNGWYVNPSNYSQYYVCWYGRPTLYSCPTRYIFDGQTCVSLEPIITTPETSDSDVDSIIRFACRSPGSYRATHPLDKHLYIQCIDERAYIKRCPHSDNGYYLVFDGPSEQCVEPHGLFKCPETNGKYRNPRNNNQYYVCRNGMSRLHSCPAYSIFNGQTCTKYRFRCPRPNGRFRNPLNVNQYYLCRNRVSVLYACPENSIFDGKTCTRSIRCPQPNGKFRNPQNDSQYYDCVDNVPRLHSCPANSIFDGQICVKTFYCRDNGRYVNPHNSNQYYQCWNGVEKLYSCAPGQIFDSQTCVDLNNNTSEDNDYSSSEEEDNDIEAKSKRGTRRRIKFEYNGRTIVDEYDPVLRKWHRTFLNK